MVLQRLRVLNSIAMLRLADVAVTTMWAVSGTLRRPRLPAPTDPTLILTVVDRTVVALDENVVALTLLRGTPTLGFLGAPGVALTVGLKRGGVLLSILVLPLTIPLLIFATAAMDAASMHLPVDGYLAILGALLAGTATLSPFATAAALRISIQ